MMQVHRRYVRKVTDIAEREWARLQDGFGIDDPMPTLVFDKESLASRVKENREKLRFPGGFEPEFAYDGEAGHGKAIVLTEIPKREGFVFLKGREIKHLVGPVAIVGVKPEQQPVVVQHEFSHYIFSKYNPRFHIAQTLSWDGKDPNSAMNRFTYMFTEAMCWIPPAQLGGKEALQLHFNEFVQNPTYLMDVPENLRKHIIYSNWLIHNTAADLHINKGYGMKSILDPMQFMTEDFPIVKGEFEKEVKKFKEAYDFGFNEKKDTIKVYCDDSARDW